MNVVPPDNMKVHSTLRLRMLKQVPGADIPAWDDWQEGDESVFRMPLQTDISQALSETE